MPRPSPTKAERNIKSDLLVVRPYAIGIVAMGFAALTSVVLTLAFVNDSATAGTYLDRIIFFTIQVIGILLILAKQVETVHRINSQTDELLEAAGLKEYMAGKKQGKEDAARESTTN